MPVQEIPNSGYTEHRCRSGKLKFQKMPGQGILSPGDTHFFLRKSSPSDNLKPYYRLAQYFMQTQLALCLVLIFYI